MSYEQFAFDRDQRGRPAEYMIVEYFRARGIDAYVNDAPEEDYEGRAAYDVVIGGEAWDVKTDFIAGHTKRIFVEKASLDHTRASRFAYMWPTAYGFEIRILTVDQLHGYYNAVLRQNRGDGTFREVDKYKHDYAGDQIDNIGVFVPLDVVKLDGLAPWRFAQIIKQQAA